MGGRTSDVRTATAYFKDALNRVIELQMASVCVAGGVAGGVAESPEESGWVPLQNTFSLMGEGGREGMGSGARGQFEVERGSSDSVVKVTFTGNVDECGRGCSGRGGEDRERLEVEISFDKFYLYHRYGTVNLHGQVIHALPCLAFLCIYMCSFAYTCLHIHVFFKLSIAKFF